MNQTRITPIFIPILCIPGLMASDNSKFFKEYSFLELDNKETLNTSGIIDNLGRAIIEIIVGPEIKKIGQFKKENRRIEYVILRALVDTGAQISSIRKCKVKILKQRTFKGAYLTGMNLKESQMRNVNLSVLLSHRSNGFIDICPVVAEFTKEYDFDFIIGWDILKYCSLLYDGTSKKIDLKFIGNVDLSSSMFPIVN